MELTPNTPAAVPGTVTNAFRMITGFGADAVKTNTPQAYGVISSLGTNLGVQFTDVGTHNQGAFGVMTGTVTGQSEAVHQALQSISFFSDRFTNMP